MALKLEVQIDGNKIYSPLRDKWLVLTPEEQVRQNYICRLVNVYGYELEQMDEELKVNNSHRGQGKARADIVIWKSKEDKKKNKTAFIVIECKAETVKIRQEDYYQGANYAAWSGASFFVTTNEKETKFFRVDKDSMPKDLDEIENAKTQILNVLELILKESDKDCLSFDKKTFGDYINKSQEILSQRDRFKYLREHFRCFPQFVFYTLYQNKGDTEKSIWFINEVNKWAEHYKHDSNSFIQPNKMFHNASKQLERKINIFVAMPYYDKTTVKQFNKTLESLVEEMKQEDELLKDKLNLYPIMTYKAESFNIRFNFIVVCFHTLTS